MESFEHVKKLGSGNFGVITLMRHKETGELVAVKQLEVRLPFTRTSHACPTKVKLSLAMYVLD